MDKEKTKERLKKWRQSESGRASIARAREKSREWRKKWSQEYYKKNKAHLNKKQAEYRKLHPEVDKRSQDKCRQKNILRGRKDREQLKPHYVKSMIKASPFEKTEQEVIIGVLQVRIERQIERQIERNKKKICKLCKELVDVEYFRKHGVKKDGTPIYSARCNPCYSIHRKKYKTDPEKKKATDKRYYENNREKIRLRQKSRYEQHHNTKKSSV